MIFALFSILAANLLSNLFQPINYLKFNLSIGIFLHIIYIFLPRYVLIWLDKYQ